MYAELKNKGVFSHPVKNFSRFDNPSKITCCLIALALKDAQLKYYPDSKQNIGIVGTNDSGSLNSNLNYFKDYIEGGRKLGRANLFIYTLASSPLAEAAIHFNFEGAMFYVDPLEQQIPSLLNSAAGAFSQQQGKTVLAVKNDGDGGICFVLENIEKSKNLNLYRLRELIEIAENKPDLNGLIKEIKGGRK